jgi:hypothetical protein
VCGWWLGKNKQGEKQKRRKVQSGEKEIKEITPRVEKHYSAVKVQD